jgi:hypothetical protein
MHPREEDLPCLLCMYQVSLYLVYRVSRGSGRNGLRMMPEANPAIEQRKIDILGTLYLKVCRFSYMGNEHACARPPHPEKGQVPSSLCSIPGSDCDLLCCVLLRT